MSPDVTLAVINGTQALIVLLTRLVEAREQAAPVLVEAQADGAADVSDEEMSAALTRLDQAVARAQQLLAKGPADAA